MRQASPVLSSYGETNLNPHQFHSIAAVDAWLNRDRLPCPQCGQRFEHLGRHLAASHDMSADDFRTLYGIPHNRGLVGARLKKRLVLRQRLELSRDRGHRAKFVGARRRRPYSVHPPSGAQLGDLRNRIQPMGNDKRWGKSK
jgi:predicted transcriptional regulator